MAKKSFKSIWPGPVYVATFADGTTQRMSFASPANKPLDFERGRRLLAWACAQGEVAGGTCFRLKPMSTPRDDMIAGHIEHDGVRHDDPHFAARNVVAPLAREAA